MRTNTIMAIAAAAALSACAHPQPGPNPQAAAVQAPPTAPLATKPSLGDEAVAVADNRVVVLFPQGGATLTPEADRSLDLAARLFRDANPSVMFSAGYADGMGNEYANLLLSARRAQVVKQALAERGIPSDKLLLQAFGASEPADPQNPTDAANRRVVITWRLL